MKVEKVKANIVYHFGTNIETGRKYIRHFKRVVRVDDKQGWRPPRNPAPLPQWAKDATWTLWDGRARIDGQERHVVGVSPDEAPPSVFVHSADYWRDKEMALAPWLDGEGQADSSAEKLRHAPEVQSLPRVMFGVDMRSVSLNRIYAGKHWAQRRAVVMDTKLAVRAALPQVLLDGDQWPVQMVDYWVEAWFVSKPQDSDNLGFVTKMIIDALKGWVVPDDDISHVRWVSMRSHAGNEDRVVITAQAVQE